MKENGIKSIIRKKYKYRHYQAARVAQNILNREFNETQSLKALTMDIAYIEVLGTRIFLYLNATKDISNKETVVYELSLNNNAELVDKTLEKPFKLPLTENYLIHTDKIVHKRSIVFKQSFKYRNNNRNSKKLYRLFHQ